MQQLETRRNRYKRVKKWRDTESECKTKGVHRGYH